MSGRSGNRWIVALAAALAAALAVAGAPLPAAAQQVVRAEVRSEQERFRVVRLVSGLQNPWAVAFLPDGRALLSERSGRLSILEAGRLLPVGGLPDVAAGGQGGLLDLALHPEYSRTGWLYFSYAARPDGQGPGQGGAAGGAVTRVARARLRGRELVDLEVLFSMNRGSSAGVHFGSRLAFLPDGTLAITVGDRGDRERAQSLAEHAGKTLRIHDDGRIPVDNPFVGRPGALPEIYSYGHRNAQGLAVQPGSGRLWLHEHGPRGGDEVNLLRAGDNYGWPLATHGREYTGGEIGVGPTAPGTEPPLAYWVPSIAPSGMAFYTGDAFPAWRGNLFVGALAGRHLRRLVVEGTQVRWQEVLLQDELGRIRDVRQGPDGLVYLLTDERDGALYRLEPLP